MTTPPSGEQMQQQKRKLPWWAWLIAGVAVAALIGYFIDLGDEGEATPPEELAATTEPAEEPTEDAASEDAEAEAAEAPERFEIADYHEGEVTVRFEISDNFTQKLISSGAERDTEDAILAATEAHPDYESVLVIGTFPTIDEKGNENPDSIILSARYTRDTIESINWDNIALLDLWDLADASTINPDLRNPE